MMSESQRRHSFWNGESICLFLYVLLTHMHISHIFLEYVKLIDYLLVATDNSKSCCEYPKLLPWSLNNFPFHFS